jgi:hypothetical protein
MRKENQPNPRTVTMNEEPAPAMTREQAKQILDRQKAGARQHPVLVTQALIATGDLYMAEAML